MPTRYVRMPILTEGGPKALGTLDELAHKVRELNADDPRIAPQVEDTEAQVKLKDLKTKIAILNRERVELSANVKDEKAKAKLLDIRVQLRKLGEMQADPEVALRHADETEAKLIRLKLLLDDINGKTATANVRVDQKGGLFNQVKSRLFGGTGGVAGRGGVISGLFSGGAGQGISSLGPQGIAGLISLALALGPGVVGLGLGGLSGLGLIGGGIAGSAYGNKQIKADQANIKAVQAALKAGTPGVTKQSLREANKQLTKDMNFFAPFMSMMAPFKEIVHNMLAAIRPLMGPLSQIFKGAANDIKGLLPQITTLFKASLPFIKEFVRVLAQSGKSLLPAFTAALNEMVKSGALKEMTDALLILIRNGLVPFLRNLGPGMKASATVFKALMIGLASAMSMLGAIATYIAKGFALFGHQIMNVGRIIGALLTGNWKALRNALADFGKTFLEALGNLRHLGASILDALGLGKVGHAIAHFFDGVRHDVASIWDSTWAHVVNVFMGVYHNLVHAFENVKHALLKSWNETTHLLSAVWRQFWESTVGTILKRAFDIITNILDHLRHWLSSTFDRIRHDVAAIWDGLWHILFGTAGAGKSRIMGVLSFLWAGIKRDFTAIKNWAVSSWHAFWDGINNATRTGINILKGILHRLEDIFGGPVAWVVNHPLNFLVNIWDKIVGAIGQKNLQFHLPHVSFAEGGRVMSGTGPKSDDVLARVSKGETIVSAAHSAQLAPIFSAIGVPGYAEGGIPNPLNFLKHIGHEITNWLGKDAAWIAQHAFGPLLHIGVPGTHGGLFQMFGGMVNSLAHFAARGIFGSISKWGGPIGAPGFGIAPNGPIQRYARELLGKYGWASQWPAFNSLVMAESGWRWNATNPSSGAYGIPQALPPGKMASAGPDWRTNPFTQLRWMMGYIRERWGSPANAWGGYYARGSWYGSGFHGWFDRPTLIGVGERGRERVDITPGGGHHGHTYNINVTVPANANTADVGRVIVTAIKEYERRSGSGWRR